MTKVLVVGATGLVGSRLIEACRKQGKDVRALVRAARLADKVKIDPLRNLGAHIYEGSLEDFDSLLKACEGVDVVISAVGGAQIMQQTSLIKAAQQTSIQRFIPSDYGLNPKNADKGSCPMFDQKAIIHQSVKDSGLSYTFVHSNGFFEYWIYGLGQLGLSSPAEQVQVYGDGTAKAAVVSLSDFAKVTAATVDDPRTKNKDLHITANVVSQEELIRLWEEISGKRVKRMPVSLEDLERIIATSNTPAAFLTMIYTQLIRSVWIRGESVKRPKDALEATELYPHIQFATVKQALSQFV
jgi:phenylcoumaran benzylic ether reductase